MPDPPAKNAQIVNERPVPKKPIDDAAPISCGAIVTLVAVMTRSPPDTIQVSLRPNPRGWTAVVGRPGVDMQMGFGVNESTALEALLKQIVMDARVQQAAIQGALSEIDKHFVPA